MKYTHLKILRDDADLVAEAHSIPVRQDSLDDQLRDLRVLASIFGLYDAADWLRDLQGRRESYQRDYGELPV